MPPLSSPAIIWRLVCRTETYFQLLRFRTHATDRSSELKPYDSRRRVGTRKLNKCPFFFRRPLLTTITNIFFHTHYNGKNYGNVSRKPTQKRADQLRSF